MKTISVNQISENNYENTLVTGDETIAKKA
jgi:hypothetical protein